MGNGRKRKQAKNSSKSGSSASDNSLLSPGGCSSVAKVNAKKQRTDEVASGDLASTTAREALSKFEFVPRDKGMADISDSGETSEQGKNEENDVFSPDRDSRPVSNEDLMAKLCANGKDISRLSIQVEQLRSEIVALQIENDSLRKEAREAKKREDSLKDKMEEIKFTANLADSRSEELSCYIRRNNLRIFGVDESTGRNREETPEECEKKVLTLIREKLKVKIEHSDIEAVHRLGAKKSTQTSPGSSTQQQQQQQQSRPRGIIIRFVNRRVRDTVLYARRKLRGTRTLIVEDLTPRAYSLLCKVREDTAICKQCWTKNDLVELSQDEQYMKENGIDKIDLIIGVNNKEGAIVLIYPSFMGVTQEFLFTADFFGTMMDQCLVMKRLRKNAVLRKTVEFYYLGAQMGQNVSKSLDGLVDMYGDCLLTMDILRWAQILAASCHSGARKVYVFDHDFAYNNAGPVPGSHHGDELVLEFDNTRLIEMDSLFLQLNKTGMADEELPLSDKYIRILTTFAKTGNPSPALSEDLGVGQDWPQFTEETQTYLSLAPKSRLVPNMGPYPDRLALWTTFLSDLNTTTADLPEVAPPQPQEQQQEGEEGPPTREEL